MSNFTTDSQQFIPPKPEVPDTARLAVLGDLRAGQKKELGDLSKKFSKIEAIEKDHQARLQKLFVRPGYPAFRKTLASFQEKLMDQVFPAERHVSDKEMAKLLVERNRKAQEYLEKNGIKLGELRELNKKTRESIARIAKPPIDMHDGKPVHILKPEEVPVSIRTGKTNPWTIKTPPYDGWSWHYSGYLKGFSFIPTLFLNHSAGYIGSIDYLKDSSAGDFDYGYVSYDSQVSMWYKMPSAGILEVYVEAEPTFNLHYCSLYDEWGWSDSSVYQQNYITLQVNGGTIRTSWSSYWYEHGYTDGHWSNSYLQNGIPYWFHLYSTGAYAKDAWVLVKIGTRNWNDCFANDVSTYSEVDFRWFLKRVFIRVT
jgi:hypothetical protein